MFAMVIDNPLRSAFISPQVVKSADLCRHSQIISSRWLEQRVMASTPLELQMRFVCQYIQTFGLVRSSAQLHTLLEEERK